MSPERIKTLHLKGVSLKYLDRTQEALECFDKALELDPTFELALKAKKDILEVKD